MNTQPTVHVVFFIAFDTCSRVLLCVSNKSKQQQQFEQHTVYVPSIVESDRGHNNKREKNLILKGLNSLSLQQPKKEREKKTVHAQNLVKPYSVQCTVPVVCKRFGSRRSNYVVVILVGTQYILRYILSTLYLCT